MHKRNQLYFELFCTNTSNFQVTGFTENELQLENEIFLTTNFINKKSSHLSNGGVQY